VAVERNPPADLVAEHLNAAAIHVLRSLRAADARAPIGPAALSALSVLVFAGPRTVGELARAEQVRSPTMSGVLKGLESEGLVRRERVAHDARQSVVHATARGRRLMERARRARITALAARLEDLAPAERARLLDATELMERVALAGRPRTHDGPRG
jgi:DNA-binding MarR family transcriptional regulator